MIARDVIDRVISGFYQAESVYFKQPESFILSPTADVKVNFNALEGCSVCAWGSVMLSTTLFKNRLTMGDIKGDYERCNKTDNLLLEVFTPETLTLIENAFEIRSGGHAEKFVDYGGRFLRTWRKKQFYNLQKKAIMFGSKYSENDKKHRLLAIMYNIIHNDGVFVP